MRLVLASAAERAIIPLQDYLGIGPEGRMNTPSTPRGNWEWRAEADRLTPGLSERMEELARVYGRK